MLRKIYRATVPGFIRSIISGIRSLPAESREFRRDYDRRGIRHSRTILFWDWVLCRAFLGATPDDYFKYRFYDMEMPPGVHHVAQDDVADWRVQQWLGRREDTC